MAKQAKTSREAKTGQFVVRSQGKKASGALVWEIRSVKGHPPKVVITSPSSAASIEHIKKKHHKALERLAKK